MGLKHLSGNGNGCLQIDKYNDQISTQGQDLYGNIFFVIDKFKSIDRTLIGTTVINDHLGWVFLWKSEKYLNNAQNVDNYKNK